MTPNVTVTIGSVIDQGAKYKNDPDPLGMYTDYQVRNRYEGDPHTYMAGVTSPGGFQGDSVAFFRLCTKTLLWISDWTACRWHQQPVIADYTSQDRDWVLMDTHFEPGMIVVPGDGKTPLYRISGTYVYGKRNPNAKIQRDISFALPPWLENSFDRTMPDKFFVNDIISDPRISFSPGPVQR